MKKALSLFVLCSLVLFSGCESQHPGNWPQEKVQEQVEKSLELSDVTLTPNPAGGYTGTGTAADGETFDLTITQDPEAKSMSWKAAGSRGSMEDGAYEFE